MCCVNGRYYSQLYRNRLSGYSEWVERGMEAGAYFNGANIGPRMSIDETCLGNGEVWTFLTNKDGHGGPGTLAAAIPGTRSDDIISFLCAAMGKALRRRVTEVTCDLSPSMTLIAAEVFHNAHVVNDRFHVQQVYNQAVDEIRIDIRRQLIARENELGPSAAPTTYSNGETMRQILARSKHALLTSSNKWTPPQRHRVNILFKHSPMLRQAYDLSMRLRAIFNRRLSVSQAMLQMDQWRQQVVRLGNGGFRAVVKTFKNHAPTILNYFRRRATNASAEAFNSKVKIFRSQLRGLRDRDFFIFRLAKLFG